MADPSLRYADNVDGDFFVDSTCINCDTCRQLAPRSFADEGAHSYVFAQPKTNDERRDAGRALVACPTASIGSADAALISECVNDFPLLLEEEVYYCGFNSEKSYGANSYFVQSEHGNWLVDSPRYTKQLVEHFKKLGGIKYVFLTHRDDVADASKYATEFGAQRIIHVEEKSALRDAEIEIVGTVPQVFNDDVTLIPVPGHTKGHVVLLFKEKFLFTGDHLAYEPEYDALIAFRNHCWYSWREQTMSMKKLLDFKFEWVLPGHGARVKRNPFELHHMLDDLVSRMSLPEEEWYTHTGNS